MSSTRVSWEHRQTMRYAPPQPKIHDTKGKTMSEIRTFDSFEEMQAAMREGLEWGNAHVHPRQQEVTFGDHWCDFRQIHDEGHVVFGRVWTLEESAESSRNAGASAFEVEAETQAVIDSHQEGMLFGEAHSRFYPRAELGSTHRLHLWPITPQCYASAAAAEWRLERIEPAYLAELQQAFDAWREHWNEVHSNG